MTDMAFAPNAFFCSEQIDEFREWAVLDMIAANIAHKRLLTDCQLPEMKFKSLKQYRKIILLLHFP